MTQQLLIKDFPKEERPRERFIHHGPSSLSNQELLAIILRTGTKNESVLQLAQRLIKEFQGLRMLMNASLEELTKIKGVGEAKAIQLLAAIELGKRIANMKNEERYVIRSPEDGANYVMEEMRFLTQEHFVCLFLNTKNEVIHKQTIFIGSLNASIVHPRELFKEAFRRSAASMICLHNHPSGNPEPSREDIEVTRRLVECGRILGVDVLDHIIIGDKRYVSLKEKGYL
ncbi:DNA repair protein RadC [Caldifermentibacillus hisashii]|uniref:DNA repair protein RadC n=1 Tax=Caldifermentibacillus hisashii TaxID=996558 RepID=A0ABU9JZP2_9BACI|nr:MULTISPECIES: DNA repair protein RadC [Bacillaceae]MCB5933492.1 DNA repair protein RadC [Bacillus sp. DFI.2.34]AWI12995.1 JAB domain-containing protein [Caldibacillus thermoamylovorans]MBU5342582.1 DNA repair protein RadC [Caldifermentibacillus hisashii]MCB7070087.1 DNA repair protein RadC [Caldibacillus sp. 210928-DFI.2.22]MCB7072604.1 DNA repair protein RadC [Caldibacillus sp. 210928-DFI.2.18]